MPFTGRRNIREIDSSRACGPVALPNGTIQVQLRDGIRLVKNKLVNLYQFALLSSVHTFANMSLKHIL